MTLQTTGSPGGRVSDAVDHSPDVAFRAVSKHFGDVKAVDDIDFDIGSGRFVALLGPSGCGKTTCLRMIGGFEEPTSGEVLIRGQRMAGVPAYSRPVNMVFQHYALFPHMGVSDNIAYGLKQMRPRLDQRVIEQRVGDALAMVRLDGFGKRRVHELSGGQQQRVALARALVNRPAVLLLDEPLAALDKKLRTDMQIELQTLQRDLGITFLLVTHDQEEALSMADRVCVMNKGRIAQFDAPSVVYDQPADLFVAGFVGKTNLIAGTVAAPITGHVTGQGAAVRIGAGTVVQARAGVPLAPGRAATVSIRPEALKLRPDTTTTTAPAGVLAGLVTHRIFLGASVEYALDVTGIGPMLASADQRRHDAVLMDPGMRITIEIQPGAAIAFAAETT